MSESYADTIKPKSDQLNADDLLVGPITVKVLGVTRGPIDQPVHIAIEGQQPYKPCKSMRRVLITAWGDKGADWVGKSMTLYCDPSVKFGGVELGGIRISHMSHTNGILNIMLTVARGRKAQYVIKPLIFDDAPVKQNTKPQEIAYDFDDTAKAWVHAINSGSNTLEEIKDETYRAFIKERIK